MRMKKAAIIEEIRDKLDELWFLDDVRHDVFIMDSFEIGELAREEFFSRLNDEDVDTALAIAEALDEILDELRKKDDKNGGEER